MPLMWLLAIFTRGCSAVLLMKSKLPICGEIASLPLFPLTASCLAGLFQEMVEVKVNQINAPFIARERGIKIKEISSDSAKNYRNMIILSVRDGHGTYRLAGTLLNRNDPRIVQIGDYRIEIVPSRYMLVTTHHDRPGVVGKVGSLLGEEQINIASMQLGRASEGGQAMMVLQVDSPVSPEVVEKLSKLNVITMARFIELPEK